MAIAKNFTMMWRTKMKRMMMTLMRMMRPIKNKSNKKSKLQTRKISRKRNQIDCLSDLANRLFNQNKDNSSQGEISRGVIRINNKIGFVLEQFLHSFQQRQFNNYNLVTMIRSSKNQKLVLRIQKLMGKSKLILGQDNQAELEIVYKKKSYVIKKYQMEFSGYFAKLSEKNVRKVEITQQFDERKFQNLISVMFGNQIEVQRSEIGDYFCILQFLQMDSLVRLIKIDMANNIEDYNIFVVFAISQEYSDQELFELCHEQLYKEQFEQISYHEFEFLHLKLSLFRLIMKMHNKYKEQNGIEVKYVEIDALIKRYCELNHLAPDIRQSLKFELIGVNPLSSRDYKTIYLDQANRLITKASFEENTSAKTSQEVKLRMENTFERKRNSQLTAENNNLRSQLQKFMIQGQKNVELQELMEKHLNELIQEKSKKDDENAELKKIIGKYESMLQYMQNELDQKTTEINGLISKFEEMKSSKVNGKKPKNDPGQSNCVVQSQYLPSHFIQEVMSKHKNHNSAVNKEKQKKKNHFETEQQIQMII